MQKIHCNFHQVLLACNVKSDNINQEYKEIGYDIKVKNQLVKLYKSSKKY